MVVQLLPPQVWDTHFCIPQTLNHCLFVSQYLFFEELIPPDRCLCYVPCLVDVFLSAQLFHLVFSFLGLPFPKVVGDVGGDGDSDDGVVREGSLVSVIGGEMEEESEEGGEVSEEEEANRMNANHW